MEDTDLIACVYPHTDVGNVINRAFEASSRYAPPQLQIPKAQRGRRDRESTEPPEQGNAPVHFYLPRLELRFSDIPRTSYGIVFGSDPNCDVVLSNVPGISSHHFSVTFDHAKRPIVKDWGSLVGTEVTYDGEGHGTRSNFQWIAGGHEIPQKKESIIITVHKTISFQIIVAHHDITSQAYINRVDQFCQGTAAAEDLFGDLGLPNRPGTERPTGAHTPSTGEIHLRKTLGEGGYGVVTHFWNVSDGSEFALKEPTVKAIRKRVVNYDEWNKEARIMGQISHPHIVRLFKANFMPHPQLCLEYAPGGSLEDQEHITADETLSILHQCLSALTYLHGNMPPIVHRDIKPGNILVQHRFPGDIYVKFGDFGLSRDSYELLTICGSRKYLAPEIYLEWQYICSGGEERTSYTPAVDVWSLGVVVYELMCGLPRYKDSYTDGGAAWCEKIVERFQKDLEKWPDALRRFLLNTMAVISSESRFSAHDCYELAVLLPSAAEAGCQTPRPASYAEEEEQTTFRYSPEDHVADDQGTVVWQPRSYADYATVSSYEGSFVRSEAPPPESFPSASRTTQKRAAVFKAPSSSLSSSARRHAKRREGRSRRSGSVSNRQPELAYFVEDYSPDPLDPLYVGSSLASWVGQEESGSWVSQSSHGSTLQNQSGRADAQTGRGPGLVSPRNRSSVPRSHGGGWRLENGDPFAGGNDQASPLGLHADEEMLTAAILLQAMGQDFRQ